MQERRQYDRRTGVVFLSLIAATNVIPWMELLLGETRTAEELAPSEIRVAIGTSLVALIFLLGAWFSGRRNAVPGKALIREPRRAGLQLSLAAAGGNLVLAAVIKWLGARHAAYPAELPIFAAAWYLVILPTELIAAFSLGRAGRSPGRRRDEVPPG
jgi:hypothetical protein